MKKNLIIYLTFIGLISLLSGCEKDGTKVVISDPVVAPTLVTLPNLTLQRVNASNTLVFVGTPVDPGFQASATYSLEACAKGTNFADPISVITGVQDTAMKTTVSELNTILLTKFPADAVSEVDFRIRCLMTVDAGTGAEPMVYISATKTANVTTYGPPTLALTTAGTVQGIYSPTDNKKYAGWIYTDGTGFTFTNKDDGKVYGEGPTAGKLVENGTPIVLEAGGYDLTVDMTDPNNITFTSLDVTIGSIGDAVGGWGGDTKMIFNFTDRTWNTTKDVIAGGIKFRSRNTWALWNVAYRPNDHNLNNLYQSHGLYKGVVLEPDLGDSQNIDDIAPGKYDIKLYMETKPMKVVFTKI
jgi:starch-binding outer membrane protein SusE/F